MRLSAGPQVERHVFAADDVLLGSGDTADLVIDHRTVAPRHARLLVRRGRLVLVDVGGSGKGVRVGDKTISAPVVLERNQAFELGDVEVSAWIDDEPSLVDERVANHEVLCEIDSIDSCTRRYRVRSPAGELAEMSVLGRGLGPELIDAWYGRSHAASGAGGPHLTAILAHGAIRERPYLIESVPAGVRAAPLLRAVSQSGLRVPAEAVVAIGAQAASAAMANYRSWGPHGAIEPRAIQLGVDGSVTLLRPGPRPQGFDDPVRRPYLSPRRRHGTEAALADDAWSVGRLIADLLGPVLRDDWPRGLAGTLASLSDEAPATRAAALEGVADELIARAHDAGLDPSTRHVGAVARLLAPSVERQLARRNVG